MIDILEKAYYRISIESNENEEQRAGVKKIPFTCYDLKQGYKEQRFIIENNLSNRIIKVIQTGNRDLVNYFDEERLAIDDTVEYKGKEYSVQRIEEISSIRFVGVKELKFTLAR